MSIIKEVTSKTVIIMHFQIFLILGGCEDINSSIKALGH